MALCGIFPMLTYLLNITINRLNWQINCLLDYDIGQKIANLANNIANFVMFHFCSQTSGTTQEETFVKVRRSLCTS